MLKGFQIFDL